MRAFAQPSKVCLEDGDESAVIGGVQEFLAVDAQDRKTDLEQHTGSFQEEDV